MVTAKEGRQRRGRQRTRARKTCRAFSLAAMAAAGDDEPLIPDLEEDGDGE